MKGPSVLFACLSMLAAPHVAADVVHLKNGRTLEGTTRPGSKTGTVEVRKGDGAVVVIPEADILTIEKKPNASEELEGKLAALPEGELGPLVELLVWARDKRLPSGVKAIARKILSIDPNHELAREELGYVVFQNRWILKSELKKTDGLVYFQNEWVTRAEKERRLREELCKEFAEHLEGAGSDNPYIQDYSIRKVIAEKDPAVRDILATHLRHPNEKVRMVAVAVLAKFPVKEGEAGSEGAETRSLAADLHRLALEERSEKVLKLVYFTLARFHAAESFRLALATATSSASQAERQRAAEILYYTLRKSFVPELCRGVTSLDGSTRHPEVREVLRRTFQEFNADFGYNAEEWLRFWEANKARFYDEA